MSPVPLRLPRAAARLVGGLVIAMLAVQGLDLVVTGAEHGVSPLAHLAAVGPLPGLAGLATVVLAGAVLTRRETARPCPRWSVRARDVALALLLALAVQELVAVVLDAGHVDGPLDALLHGVDLLVPAAVAAGSCAAAAIGVARVLRRVVLVARVLGATVVAIGAPRLR
ncbi:hypothetical protein ACVU7I_17595, partial [Patulibacter sp. S7RM1-6]